MKNARLKFLFAAVFFCCCLARLGANAQIYGFSATNSDSAIELGDSVTYSYYLTNFTGITAIETFITNTFSQPVQIGAIDTSYTLFVVSTNTTSTNTTVLFDLESLPSAYPVVLNLTVTPTVVGSLTNAVVLTELTSLTNFASTNLITQVTNTTVLADLAVSMSGPSAEVFAGDWMSYGVSVTNFGPDSVDSVQLTNQFPGGVGLRGVSPAVSAKPVGGVLILNLGTLASGASTNFVFTVIPTNTGTYNFTAAVGALSVQDTNPANNYATNPVAVNSIVTGQLIATNASAMTYNPQTGLMDQTVMLANVGTSSVASARVIITGLTNRLYNAAGTNNGNPFVNYASTLDIGQSAPLILEYFVPTRSPISVANSNYVAFATSAANLVPVNGTNGTFAITNTAVLTGGYFLLEFPAVSGKVYTVIYCATPDFASPLTAQPSVQAPANRVQWIDDGPPKTISNPATAGSRYYRVFQNP